MKLPLGNPVLQHTELLRLATLSLLIPPLALLLQTAHAYLHSSTRYFLNNALIDQAPGPALLAFLFGQATITFIVLAVSRRFVLNRRRFYSVAFFLIAAWTLFAICGELSAGSENQPPVGESNPAILR